MHEFHSLAKQQANEALGLTAALLADCVARVIATPLDDVERARECAVSLLQSCGVANGCRGSSGVRRRQRDERDAAIEEGWSLLRIGLIERLPSAASISKVAPLLERDVFEQCVNGLERHLLPVELASPLVSYCARLARGVEGYDKALPALLRAVRAKWPLLRGSTLRDEHGKPSSAVEQLDALLSREAANEARNESRGSDLEAEVVAQRRLCLLQQCAPRLFPPTAFVVYASCTASVKHSCVPNAQLQLITNEHEEPPQQAPPSGAAASSPSLPQVALVALRPRQTVSEESSLAWVDVALADERERAAALRRHFDDDGFVCRCERCVHERHGHRALSDHPMANGTCPTLVMLARDAIEDGRQREGATLLRARIDAAPDDGDAWMMLGTVLLSMGQWTRAHEAWRRGAQRAPEHPLLAKQQRKDALFCLAEKAGCSRKMLDAAYTCNAECEVHTLRSLGATSGSFIGRALQTELRVVVSRVPLFTECECAAAIRAAEEHASRSGGWTTARHHAVPTTDVPVHDVPDLLIWFNEAMACRLGPLLACYFGAARVRVHDAFLVKYTAGAQAHLPLHVDESQLSLTIVLNDAFSGGGTFFADLGRALSPRIGHVVAFDGEALHGGEPIVRGTRYIIAAFLYVDDPPVQRGETPSADDGDARLDAPRRGSLEALFAAENARSVGLNDTPGCDHGSEAPAGGGFTFGFGS